MVASVFIQPRAQVEVLAGVLSRWRFLVENGIVTRHVMITRPAVISRLITTTCFLMLSPLWIKPELNVKLKRRLNWQRLN